uniref:Uncharacterized protein n=1 Tax=viral metagenome TaxID=1070528 RepID=A0A6M3LVA6_9ZZZZ
MDKLKLRKNPCEGCRDKVEDQWGLFCDISCGLATTYIHYMAGVIDTLCALTAEVKNGK